MEAPFSLSVSYPEVKPIPKERPRVFGYLNFREYLTDMTTYLRSIGRYSERSFARRSGFRSSSSVRMVSKGQRNLSISGAQKVAKGFGLDGLETRYFIALVQYGQATQPTEQARFHRRLISLKRFQSAHENSNLETSYFSCWQAVAILEALGVPEWGARSMSQMADSLKTTEAEIQNALNLLEKLNLITKESGLWKQVYSSIHTLPETNSVHLRAFHKEMILKGLDTIDSLPTNDRKLYGLTIRLDAKTWHDLSSMIFDKLREWNATYAESPHPDKVYHFSVLSFPLVSLKD